MADKAVDVETTTTPFVREHERGPDDLRPTQIIRPFLLYAEGSCLIQMGRTRVLCAVSIEDGVPPWLRGQGRGWITAEYSMLPRSTPTRTPRESGRGRPSGRTMEIQRMIGRALRGVVDLSRLGERTLWIDCDVIEADGGTRTAAITGSMVALYDALQVLARTHPRPDPLLREFVASVSVGMVRNFPLLDLSYAEDSQAEVDMNLVMTESGKFVEIQGTAEGRPFSAEDLETFLELGQKGIRELIHIQKVALGLEG